jgi:diketogulonate reductase-like aldo/keto reductase
VKITAYSPMALGLAHKEPLLIEIGKKYRKTGGQIALRWLIQKGIIVIPKGSTKEHLIENMSVFDFELSKEEDARIEKLPQKKLINPGFAEF